MRKIGCLLAEGWRWRGREVGAGIRRHRNSVRGDMKLPGLNPDWAVFRDIWRDLIVYLLLQANNDLGKTSNPSLA